MTLEQGQVINEEKVIWTAVTKTCYSMTVNLMQSNDVHYYEDEWTCLHSLLLITKC